MYFLLLKLRLTSLLSALLETASKKKNSRVLTVVFAVLFLYLGATFIGIFTSLYTMICPVLIKQGNDWLCLASAFIIALMLSFFSSIFTTKSQLFEATDTELLLAMPISPFVILASRMTLLLFINLIFSSIVILPASIVYFLHAGFSINGLIASIIAIISASMISLAVSAIFGWLVEIIASKTAHKTLISTVLFLAFFFAYMYLCVQLQNLMNELILIMEKISLTVSAIAPIYMLGVAGTTGPVLYALPILGISIAIFSVFVTILTKTFIKLSTTKRKVIRKQYSEAYVKSSSLFSTLFVKEAMRLFSSTVYLLNSGVGAIMQILFGVLIIITGKTALASIPIDGINVFFPIFALSITCFLSATNLITAPSVSLEGNSLWVLKSLPVATKDILKAKLMLHMVISCTSSLICATCACIGFGITWYCTPLIILISVLFSAIIGELGLIMNLKFPRFDWLSETQPIKQGAAVGLTMMLGFIMAMLIVAIGAVGCVTDHTLLAMILLLLLMFIGFILLYNYIITRGARIFESL